MAIDREDSMADNDTTISDADENNYIPYLAIHGGRNAEVVACQTASGY